jgi:N-dimethylarginine dimethylaminohydrolase
MYSKNEWGTLKKVVVGIADGAKIPEIDKSIRTVNYANVTDTSTIISGQYPDKVIQEANEDLDKFVNFLKSCNVEVVRPEKGNPKYYHYCPRDTVLIHKDKAIAAPMSLQVRDLEYLSYEQHLENVIECVNYLGDDVYNEECIGNPNILALNEKYPKFDAANIIRANDDLLYLVSNSGNLIGATYLQALLGEDVKVHTVQGIYSYMHIDSTIAFLREGLMLINPSRIKDIAQLPAPFNKWDYIMCPDPVDIGYYPGYCNASPWINVNLFSVNPNLVVLEEHQTPLRKELEKYKIDCEMLPMRHARTLSGCFHCVTLDLIREED